MYRHSVIIPTFSKLIPHPHHMLTLYSVSIFFSQKKKFKILQKRTLHCQKNKSSPSTKTKHWKVRESLKSLYICLSFHYSPTVFCIDVWPYPGSPLWCKLNTAQSTAVLAPKTVKRPSRISGSRGPGRTAGLRQLPEEPGTIRGIWKGSHSRTISHSNCR